MNTIPENTFFYVPMCCTRISVTCNSNCLSILRVQYTCVSYNVVSCVITCSVVLFLIRVLCSSFECFWSWLFLVQGR
jgi:hypothetical protein